MSEPSARLQKQARRVQGWIVHALMQATPRRPHVVVHGFPDSEGNSIEMLRATAARYPGQVYWLVADLDSARQVLDATGADPTGCVELVAHRSPEAVWRFVTAEVSMFTHGLFGNPRRVRRKVMVNLWHGGGYKGAVMADARGRPTIWSDYLVASTLQFGRERARECALPADGLLMTGNPRIAQFDRSDAAPIERIGLARDRPFVLWMPTFRRNKGRGLTGGWTELAGGVEVDVAGDMSSAVTVLRDHGIDVAVKPHPQDAESRAVPGAIVVTNEDLDAAGIQLYELLGAAGGLLTDYSSVWIDYLVLDRPIGFVMPDATEYAAGRGFSPPDALDWLPGDRLRTAGDFAAFAQDVLTGGAQGAARRAEVAQHIGHVAAPHPADAILDALAARGVFSGPLRPRAEDGALVQARAFPGQSTERR